MALDEKSHPEIPHFNDDAHVPMQVSLLMMRKTQELYTSKKITGDQLIILNVELQSFLDISGACERIKNTPIPYSYSVFIKSSSLFM